jgi:hypothetical protein
MALPHVSSSFSMAALADAALAAGSGASSARAARAPLLDKSQINVLLLENVNARAVQMLRDEGYQVLYLFLLLCDLQRLCDLASAPRTGTERITNTRALVLYNARTHPPSLTHAHSLSPP